MNASHSPSSLPLSAEALKPFACTTCTQRKVRCDKREPCSACLKSRLQCLYRTIQPTTRKRKGESSNQAIFDQLRQHEAFLRNAKAPFTAFEGSLNASDDQNDEAEDFSGQIRRTALPSDPVQSYDIARTTRLPHRGILVPEHGGHRYYEHGFIGILGQQYRQDIVDRGHDAVSEAHQAASEELASTVFTGLPSPSAKPQYRQIPSATAMKYWQTFLNNVHPLTKIIHAPTEYQIMMEDTSGHSLSTDALRYSIYACTVASVAEKECQNMFGESQGSLLYEFQSATRYKLLEASFLQVPDFGLLRAQVLLLTSMLQTSDSSSLWILMGSVMRMAQSQGLHRDGLALGLSAFDTEMRRRLWWYIVTLDGRLTELTGSESTLPKFMDTCLPSDVNDGDLDPAMRKPPLERVGSGEMTFCLVHYEAARFLAECDPRYDESERRLSSRLGRPGDRRSASELESFLEERFLRFCDPIIPVQFLTTLVARSNLCKFKQMEHRRRYQPDPDDNHAVESAKGNTTLNVAVRNIEYDNLIHSSRSLRGFHWHVKFFFPWGAPIFILKDLAFRPDWDQDMQTAWERIEELHEHHPEYKNTSRVQHLIISGLTIKAWTARELLLQSRGIAKQLAPSIIQELQIQQAAFLTKHHDPQIVAPRTSSEALNYTDFNGFDFTNFDLMDPMFADVDWSSWNGY